MERDREGLPGAKHKKIMPHSHHYWVKSTLYDLGLSNSFAWLQRPVWIFSSVPIRDGRSLRSLNPVRLELVGKYSSLNTFWEGITYKLTLSSLFHP